VVTLPILRIGAPGIFLGMGPGGDRPGAPTVLLPGSEEGTKGLAVGAKLDVFVYLDSEDRPVATLKTPKVQLGEVAFLEVTDVTSFGAFVDWGLMKELLVPLGEQTRDMRVGERHPVCLYVDDTGRLAGTMRVTERLRGKAPFHKEQWVDGEAWRHEPELGIFVILAKKHVGLLPIGEPTTLLRGDAARFRVSKVQPDGKIELSLRAHAHEEMEGDAHKILTALAAPGAAPISERMSPDDIRARFALSKKAFKRAIGRLLKERTIAIAPDGTVALAASARQPPSK
jgi:predicted RNA-binding protein (virulence factor B family)